MNIQELSAKIKKNCTLKVRAKTRNRNGYHYGYIEVFENGKYRWSENFSVARIKKEDAVLDAIKVKSELEYLHNLGKSL